MYRHLMVGCTFLGRERRTLVIELILENTEGYYIGIRRSMEFECQIQL